MRQPALGQHDGAAGGQQAEDVVDREVEIQAPTTPAPGLRGDAKAPVDVEQVLSAPRWSIITPLGRPVEPEV